MSKYLDFFDDVYYINLDSRPDRKKLFEKRASIHDINAIRFPGIIPNKGEYVETDDNRRKYKVGCTLSHQSIVRSAKERGLKNVIIFEDDCVFFDNFKEKAKIYANELKDVDWDVFYFGGDPTNDCIFITENLARMYDSDHDGRFGVYCTHAYAINHTFFDEIIGADKTSLESIDTLLVNIFNSKTNIILGSEILAVQDKSFSDLWGHIIDSSEIMKETWSLHVKKENI